MAAGYFDDGTTTLELGAHVFASAGAARRNRVLSRPSAGAVLLDSGGGILDLEVTGQRLRASRGDAEAYIYNLLVALGSSEAGDLGFEDNRRYRQVYGDALCTGGSGEVKGGRFADIRFDFTCPEKSAEPAWDAVPAAPATYAGRTNAQDYQAGGVDLGVGGSLVIELVRAAVLREIPRARGSRVGAPWSGAHMRFRLSVDRVATTETLATDVEDLVRSIGPRAVDLTGNGNTFSDVLLEKVRVRHSDRRHTKLDLTFIQEI